MGTVKSLSTRTLPDQAQVELALAGSQQAYAVLFRRHWRHLLFTVRRRVPDLEEARDVAMEAFAKAFGNLHRFNQAYHFSTWLHRIAINHSIDHRRRKRLVTTPLCDSVADDVSGFFARGNDQDHRNPEDQHMEAQKAWIVERGLGALPAKLAEVARLRFLHDCSYGEISALLGVPLGTVKARLHRARALLQQTLLPWRN
ncbi:MAG: sigma-70 family RNA polymerase sigma factor [Cytophagales bacterium]|nr:sigma-70 family RNA polymerase sigma factor [Cytophagales bacterium]